MLPDQQRGFDAWMTAHLARNNAALMAGIGEGMAAYVGKRLDQVREELRQEHVTALLKLYRELDEERDRERAARGQLLSRLAALEAERDGRAVTAVPEPQEGPPHVRLAA